jgi:hypothetical protein
VLDASLKVGLGPRAITGATDQLEGAAAGTPEIFDGTSDGAWVARDGVLARTPDAWEGTAESLIVADAFGLLHDARPIAEKIVTVNQLRRRPGLLQARCRRLPALEPADGRRVRHTNGRVEDSLVNILRVRFLGVFRLPAKSCSSIWTIQLDLKPSKCSGGKLDGWQSLSWPKASYSAIRH